MYINIGRSVSQICCHCHCYFFPHLAVIVDIDHIYRPVRVADEEDGVFIWLQHLKQVHIHTAVEKNKVPKLRQTRKKRNGQFHTLKTCQLWQTHKVISPNPVPALCALGRQCQGHANL